MGEARRPITVSPVSPNHSAPRHPIGQIPEEPTEAHKPRRDFKRAVHRTIYKEVWASAGVQGAWQTQTSPEKFGCCLYRSYSPAKEQRSSMASFLPVPCSSSSGAGAKVLNQNPKRPRLRLPTRGEIEIEITDKRTLTL